MRLLLVLNDASDGHHDDIHRSLTELRGESALEDFIVYPYIAKLNCGLKPSEVVSEVEDLANSFAPDAILWAHPSSLPVDERVVSRLRGLRSRPVLGCLEGDLYDRFHKPLPKNLRRLARACDVVFVIGYGRFVNRLVKNGFPAVLYVPLWADDSRFDLGMPDPGAATYDAVLVGNYWPSKIPFKTMPGAVQRARVVSLMEREFGDRFAVFGQGWAGPCARGPIPFDQQTLAYHMGRVAVGWDNLIVPLSFSDRLPIAMASGVPVIYNAIEGVQEVLGVDPPVRFVSSPDEVVLAVHELLRTSAESRGAQGRRARTLALEELTPYRSIRYVTEVLRSLHHRGRRVSVGADPQNPWLKRDLVAYRKAR